MPGTCAGKYDQLLSLSRAIVTVSSKNAGRCAGLAELQEAVNIGLEYQPSAA